MSQCVPSWDVLDYEVEELTWENGELSMHGLRPPQAPPKALNAAVTGNPTTWDKPPASGTLEFITHQGVSGGYGKELVTAGETAAKAVTMDASVPCSDLNQKRSMEQVFESGRVGTCGEGFPARVASCGGSVARVPKAQELSGSVSGSATWHGDLGVGFASASMGSPENTNNDEHDLICHRRSQSETRDEDYKTKRMERSSTKRNRAAAVHNQSERKRRDRINQRMKALQKLVPNSSKTDKASVLDEVITYLKQLQTQVQMMNWMKMSSMMMPITMQQQLQMSMMAQMGMSMGMNMDMNTMNIPSIPPFLHPTPFMPMASWDACGGDRLQGAPVKPVTKDAPPVSSSKS